MNKLNFYFKVLFILFSLAIGLFAQQKKLTMDDIYHSSKFQLKYLSGIKWSADGKAFYFVKHQKDTTLIMRHDLQNGQETVWLDVHQIIDHQTGKPLQLFDWTLSKDGSKILFKTDARRVWRRYDEARFLIYDVATRSLKPVHAFHLRIRHAKLSPDGNKVGYTFENNIYVQDVATGKVTQVTFDGSKDIINGQFDWVYEEEFGQSDGWRWSPDSKKIAFWRVDQSNEPTFSWALFEGIYGGVRTIHYPKAGGTNATVKIGVYHLDSDKIVWMDTGVDANQYIPRIKWTNNPDVLSIQRMNRLQNKLELLLADVTTGSTRVILTETDPCWVDVRDDLTFLKHKKQFLWTSERDGFRHIYLYDLKGKLKKQLTKGHWVVTSVRAVDEETGRVYFTANKGSSIENHVFSVKLNGKGLRRLDHAPGWHRPLFSPDSKYFVDAYSSASQPPAQQLCTADGTVLRTLIKNSIEPFKEAGVAIPQYFEMPTEDGVKLNARIIKPVDFDSTKKYPVLIYGYGGPGSQMVRNSWDYSILWYTLLTQHGYIIFTIDNRGTGGRGKAFKNLAYGNIGKYALGDHIQAAKYLAKLPYVDKNRIGIWGWSGGGYLTLMAMTKGSKYFKAGIAVAPVADFRLYDSIWTERYMGLPDQNKAGYDSTSVLNYVQDYKGGLLIVHGSSDDNVHMQNTMQFIKRLQEEEKQFRLMIYPGLNHSLLGPYARFHLFSMMADFIINNL
ncbi:S9 family peptidase [candidate division KSB1 bacterium]|nr:MAG: S9 family peptidase [candidate division KSB1 bacterium]